MRKNDSHNANLVFGKVCSCLTFVEQRFFSSLNFYLIFSTLALAARVHTSLAKRCTISDSEDVWYKVRKLIPHGV